MAAHRTVSKPVPMNRRRRKLRGQLRRPTDDELAVTEDMVANFEFLTISADNRVVIFTCTNKRFWVWDTASLLAFVSGKTYNHYAMVRARVPETSPTVSVGDLVEHRAILVPAIIAERVEAISLALYNQVVLSVAASFSFPTLAAACYRLRATLDPVVFDALRAQATTANGAKHMDAAAVGTEGLSLIMPQPGAPFPGWDGHAAPCTPPVRPSGLRADAPVFTPERPLPGPPEAPAPPSAPSPSSCTANCGLPQPGEHREATYEAEETLNEALTRMVHLQDALAEADLAVAAAADAAVAADGMASEADMEKALNDVLFRQASLQDELLVVNQAVVVAADEHHAATAKPPRVDNPTKNLINRVGCGSCVPVATCSRACALRMEAW